MTDICGECISKFCEVCMCFECHRINNCDGMVDPYNCFYDNEGNERKIK